jgi:hypothetical protein
MTINELPPLHYAARGASLRLSGWWSPLRLLALVGAGVGAYLSLVRGALTVDLGVGRRKRPLGPLTARIAAPPETVFDVSVAPYLSRTPRAMRDKFEVLERGRDMVLAAHSRPSAGSPPRPSRRSPSSAHIASRSGSAAAPCRTSSSAARSSAGTAPRHAARLHRRARQRPLAARTVVGRPRRGNLGNARSRPHSTRSAPRRSAAADEPASPRCRSTRRSCWRPARPS